MQAGADWRRTVGAWTLLSDADTGVLFDGHALEARPLSSELAGVLSPILQAAAALSPEAPEWAELAPLFEEVVRLPALRPPAGQAPGPAVCGSPAEADPARLFKLAVSVADGCNMACAYCYANGGQHHRPAPRLMDPATAVRVAEAAVDRFQILDTVQFIGGEPTLHPAAIERLCDTFRAAVDQGRWAAMPTLVLTTNGLLVDDALVAFLKRQGICPTFSLDGPPEVHDAVRPRSGGGPTYATVRANIERCLDAGLPVDFEATFSQAHLRHGMDLPALCEWFRNAFGCRVLHVPPVSAGRHTEAGLALDLETRIQVYCDGARWSIDRFVETGEWVGESFATRILQALGARQRSRTICAAGWDLLAVDAGGDVYPCWMFFGDAPLGLGPAWEEGFSRAARERLRDTFAEGDLDGAGCEGCWARPLCFGCRGADHRATGSLALKENCAFVEALVATVLLRLFQGLGPVPAGSQEAIR